MDSPRLSWGTDDDQGEHNTEPWCEQITRITPQLGMAAIKAAPVKPRRSHACSSSAVTQDIGTPGSSLGLALQLSHIPHVYMTVHQCVVAAQ
jgi:hypothetical protein